jgi:hypothetical protein
MQGESSSDYDLELQLPILRLEAPGPLRVEIMPSHSPDMGETTETIDVDLSP